jgi:hypothetical protein
MEEKPEKPAPRRGSRPAVLVDQRINEAYRMLFVDRKDEGEIRRLLSERWSAPDEKGNPAKWPCARRSVERYIRRAKDREAAASGMDRDDIRGSIVAHWWAQLTSPSSDIDQMGAAAKELARIFGCYAPSKAALTDVAGNDLPGIGMLRERLMATPEGRDALCRLSAAANRAANSSIQPGNEHQLN